MGNDPVAGNVDEEIELCPYDPEWPSLFLAEMQRIEQALSFQATIEHIGSTSVPGLVAKPVVDIMLGLVPGDPWEDAREQLGSAGYEDLGEAGVPGRVYFRRRAERSFNVHVTLRGGSIWDANLALRDYLRLNPEARLEYAEVKRRAIADGCRTLLSYSNYKSSAVTRLVSCAVKHVRDVPV